MAGVVVWTTGSFGEWRGFLWPPAIPGVERREAFRLDVKDGKEVGRKKGGRGLGPVTGVEVWFGPSRGGRL